MTIELLSHFLFTLNCAPLKIKLIALTFLVRENNYLSLYAQIVIGAPRSPFFRIFGYGQNKNTHPLHYYGGGEV
jgi:hypothetical protein